MLLEKKKVQEDLVKLLRAYSPTGHEDNVAPIIMELAKELGYEKIFRDKVGNVHAEYGFGETIVAFIPHMDTVPGKLPVRTVNDLVYGRGAVDDKGPLYSMLLGAAIVKNNVSDKLKVCFIAEVDEEGASKGAKHLIESGFKAHAIVIGEPSNLADVVVAYRGSIHLKIECKSMGGHPASPISNMSAIEKFLKLWEKISLKTPGLKYDEPQARITYIRSGEFYNKLPEYAEAHVNIRVPPSISAKKLYEEILSLASDDCRITLLDISEPVSVSINKPIVRALIRSILSHNIKPSIARKYGSSDMNTLYTITDNIVSYGPGDPSLSHSEKERISINDVILGAKIYSKLLLEYVRILHL